MYASIIHRTRVSHGIAASDLPRELSLEGLYSGHHSQQFQYDDVFASWKFPHAPLLQEHRNWVCALQSPRSMGMDPHGKVEYPIADDDTWLHRTQMSSRESVYLMVSTKSLSMKQTRTTYRSGWK